MFQSFEASTSPEQGPPRLKALRAELRKEGLDGVLIPRTDAHQGEYVAPCDERLAWLTGFTGSAGFCAALTDVAGVFIDGRYRVQVKEETAREAFTPVPWPETKLAEWLKEQLPQGGTIGFDPWLHTAGEVAKLRKTLAETQIALKAGPNLVDRVWADRPDRLASAPTPYPVELAGKSSAEKRAEVAATLAGAGHTAAVLTLPDSICWLLNIRGQDIPRIPVIQAFAILHDDGRVDLFSTAERLPEAADGVSLRPLGDFEAGLKALTGTVRIDPDSAPCAVDAALSAAGVAVANAPDPCLLPKARKNATEIAGAREAHLRDAAAMCAFLAWLDREAPLGGLTEIDVVTALEGFRRATNVLQDISFETICGSGPNGAIVHYRVSDQSNRAIQPGELLLVDSGGQYLDGTTDITRTVAIGAPTQEQRQCFTRVLQGMIAISRARWPKGMAGRDLDALARMALWQAGQDYNHGTGHGVGAFLSVHEGPQRLSKTGEVRLEPGMILSNEPGYYREGAFGIRIENLLVVDPPQAVPGGDAEREMLSFETLTWVPIDRRLVVPEMLTGAERDWLNAYHANVSQQIRDRVSAETQIWLDAAVQPI